MNALELADVMEKYIVAGFQYPLCDEFKQAATMLRQQQADKDRALKVLNEVDGILLDYIEQLEKKPMTTLAHGRAVVLAVKYMIAVLEDSK